jgi:hypothetical protein
MKEKNLLKIQQLPKVLRVQAIRSKQLRNIYHMIYLASILMSTRDGGKKARTPGHHRLMIRPLNKASVIVRALSPGGRAGRFCNLYLNKLSAGTRREPAFSRESGWPQFEWSWAGNGCHRDPESPSDESAESVLPNDRETMPF